MPKARSKTQPSSGAAILARVKPQKRVETCLITLRADLVRDFEREDEKLAGMKADAAGNTNRLNGGAEPDSPAIRTQARKVRKIEDQIVDSQTEFTFESLGKDAWGALTANHPPRANQFDQLVGYNRDAVLDGLVRACIVSPVFEDCTAEPKDGQPCPHDDCGSWQQLEKVIPPSEWRELRDTANLANSGVVDPPKSLLASQILDRRANASE